MTNHNEKYELADTLSHDLQRFLHSAHDHHDQLRKISEVMGDSAARMKGQEEKVKSVFNALRQQINSGVDIHIHADLNAHAARVEKATTSLVEAVERLSKNFHYFSIVTAVVAFTAALAGSFVGVLAAVHFL